MTNKANPKVDAHLNKEKKWQPEMAKLRSIILDCQLTEDFKWAKPCYTFQGGNIAVLCRLKECCALGFLKGALLKDPKGILQKPGEHSQSMRWMKFTSVDEIAKLEPTVKAYLREAIAAEKAGLEVVFRKPSDFKIPEELKNKFGTNSALKKAFESLTPGRQRAYVIYFSAPKQSTTRDSRIEKSTPQILAGKGMHDDYKASKK